MNTVPYEAWSTLQKFQDDVTRLFGNQESDGSRVVTSHWSPSVDIREDQDSYTLYADVPGVEAKDIEITMENGVLTIKGERKWENADERNAFKRMERARGSFYRRFSLPDSVDPEKITARGNNGVLEVVIPKLEKLQPRRIPVGG